MAIQAVVVGRLIILIILDSAGEGGHLILRLNTKPR